MGMGGNTTPQIKASDKRGSSEGELDVAPGIWRPGI